jgi:hypothetical protein
MILHRLGRLGLSLVLTLGCLATLSSGPAEAQSREAACRQVLTSPRLPADDTDEFLRLQRVLAIALDRSTPRLSDSRRGPTSEAALVDLCLAVPFPDGMDVVTETLRLIVEYDRLTGQVPDWRALLWDPSLTARLVQGSDPGLAVRLAGSPAMTAAVLSPGGAPAACGPVPFSDEMRAGLDALAAADPRVGRATDPLAQACAFYPTLAVDGALAEALARFGTLERARPGAIAALISPEFARWLAEDAQPRLRRLVGSTPAVQRLIADFRDTQPAPAPEPEPMALVRPESCEVNPRDVRYWAFGPGEATLLAGARDIGPGLRALGDLRATDTELMADILGVLGSDTSACLRDQIKALLTAPDSPARKFRLNEAGVEGLAFVAGFGNSQPTVEALVGRLAPSRELLLDGTRAAIRRSLQERYDADIERAAAIFAAAAEPLPPTVDLPAVGMPEADPVELPETFIVTEITDATLQASIENEAFVEALLGTQFSPAVSREVLMGDVRRVLRPLAAAEIDRIVQADSARVADLVEERWIMTDELANAILAIPELAQGDELPDEAKNQLLGLWYPERRLMQSAFAAVDPPLPVALRDRALALSDRVVPDPEAPRLSGSIAEPDCGCVLRRKDHSLVYAFYPFWLSPLSPPDPGLGAADPAEEESPDLPRVDFELIERIAFYGLHWTDIATPGKLDLRFRQQWLNMRRDFVFSAHRHRSRADLAIRITGWEGWTDEQIRDFVENTDDMMAPFDRFDTLSLEEAARFLPTLFDRPQPDALTLIVDGYDGVGQNPHKDKLVDLVKKIAERLKDREQDVHLAFELNLADQPLGEPIFDDIRQLLVGERRSSRVDRSKWRTVENILVFLERPTADTSRELRARMEAGNNFSTEESIAILRRILPVVPPGGHKFVDAPPTPGPLVDDQEYGQLIEDVVYFQDNFGGMGFWPAPLAGNKDHEEVADIVYDRWDLWRFPDGLENLELKFDWVCARTCPNRFYFTAAAMILGLILAGLTWRAFYSGVANGIAFRYGAVWIGNAVLLVLLALLSSCDQRASWQWIVLGLQILMLLTVVVFSTYLRARVGPKP